MQKLKLYIVNLIKANPINIVILAFAIWLIVVLYFGCGSSKPNVTTVIQPTTPSSATITSIQNPTNEQWNQLQLQAQNAQLLGELKQLKSSINSITQSIGQLNVSGSGQFVMVPGPQGPAGQSVVVGQTSTLYNYKDFRLDFTGDIATKEAKYTLTQKFEVDHIIGKQPDGKPTSLLKMFELKPDGTKIPLEATTKTTIINTLQLPSWHFSPTIQVGYGSDWVVTVPSVNSKGALISVQLLKRGITSAAEDSTIGLLSPAIMVQTNKSVGYGVVPIGLNIGKVIPHQPFKDIWVNPYLMFTPTLRAGIGVSASF